MTNESTADGGLTRLARSIVTVATGSALGSVIGFAVSPALTRLFTPTEFGTFSVATALVVILLNLATGRFELAVPLPSAERDSRDILLLGAAFASATTILLLLATVMVPDRIMSLAPSALAGILPAVPILMVPVASFTLLNAWAIRQSRYRAIATRNVAQASVTAAVQLGCGLIGFGVGGLLAGYFVGQLVGSLALLHRSGLTKFGKVSLANLRQQLRVYRRHPMALAPSGLVNALGGQAPVLVVAATYGVSAAGLLALTQRVLSVPMTLLGISTAQVYLSELSRGIREGNNAALMPLFKRTTMILCAIGLCLLALGSPSLYYLFEPLFGHQWSEAGPLAAVLTLGVAAQLVGSSVSQTLIVLQRIWLIVAWDLGRLTATVVALAYAWWGDWPLLQAISLLSGVTAITYLIYWFLSFRSLRSYINS